MGTETWPDPIALPAGTTVGGKTIDSANSLVTAITTLAVTKALHDGKTILLSLLAGFASTLPAATGSGMKVKFMIGIVNTSGSYTIATAPTTDIFKGVVNTCSTTETPDLSQPWITSTNSNLITLNGGTQGGFTIGDWITLEDVLAGVWAVHGQTTSNSTEATPFSHV
jgi:hypothetical protein